jgi:hypothetical protein
MKKAMNLIIAMVLIIGMISTVAAGAPPVSTSAEQVGAPNGSSYPVSLPAPLAPINPNAVLWDNGPLVTHVGGGAGGADASAVQTALGLNTFGFGNQFSAGIRLADDFVITDPAGWQIDSILFYGYQTGSPTNPSTFTAVNYQIWNGSPDDPTSTIVFGDTTTNRLVSSVWSNIYRVLDTAMTGTTRPIMVNTCSAGVTLPPGTYWIDLQADGTLASGPWAPPISILGQTTTGNALQYTTAWAPALDTGTITQQGLPFVIEGSVPSSDTLHINKMKAFGQYGPPGRVKWVQFVRVVDQSFAAVESVAVFGEWTLPNGTVLPATANWLTNILGDTKFQLKAANPGTYQFCVTNMTLAGYTYDPTQNEVDPCTVFFVP